nr:type I glutamate--ammonia ligase [Candidatus Hecatella orcuttiae]
MPYSKTPEGKLMPLKRTSEEVLKLLKEDGIKFIDLHFTDLLGRLQHTTIRADSLELQTFEEGVPKLDGSSIKGFTEIHESDLVLKPDPSTYGVIPWVPEDIKMARMICDVYWGFGLGRLSRDPRSIAQKAEQAVTKTGYDFSLWGPEVEFFVFDKVEWDVLSAYRGQSYRVESREAAWNSGCESGYPIRFKEGYFPASPQDTFTEFRSECAKVLEEFFGIPCDAHHHEVATAGQGEIDMYRDTLTSMGDSVMTYKFVVKNIAKQKGLTATMMPKPVFMDNASGMHVHVSLWKEGRNLFYDPEDPRTELSQLGRYFGGGLLDHGRSLAAIVAPTTNSYRRLVPGYEAPVYLAWSRSNRSAAVRVPVYHKGPKMADAKRIEFRPPDPACNPYLCFAALVAAGLDGIKKKIDIGDPVEEDIYKLSPERRRQLGIQVLPATLKEAVECLKSDSEYLKPIFPPDVIEKIIELETLEDMEVSLRPHPYEFYLYFDR